MTHFLRDILRQPKELRRTLEHLRGEGRSALDSATAAVRKARHVYLTGIGSSWHVALNVGAMFQMGSHPVYMADAAELLQFATLPRDSVLIVISRSGRSIEIVQLMAKAKESGASVIGITNAPDGTLAQQAKIAIVAPVELDHAISVNTYTTLALAAAILATSVLAQTKASFRGRTFRSDMQVSSMDGALAPEELSLPLGLAASLSQSLAETERAIPKWQEQLETTKWLALHSTTYFLARGTSRGSAYEARLMWEEGVKSPATAMGSASFRHGPQEMVAKDCRFGIWIDGARMREQDLAVARDLRKLGAKVMLIGQNLPQDSGDLIFQLPAIPSEWQFLIDIIPAQLTAERLARLSDADPDTFRLSSYVVEDDAGLLPKKDKT